MTLCRAPVRTDYHHYGINKRGVFSPLAGQVSREFVGHVVCHHNEPTPAHPAPGHTATPTQLSVLIKCLTTRSLPHSSQAVISTNPDRYTHLHLPLLFPSICPLINHLSAT